MLLKSVLREMAGVQKKQRLDRLLVQRGLSPTGEKARRAIMAVMVMATEPLS